MPKEMQVEIDCTIENMLSEKEISVFQKAYLRNEFVEGVGMGGAGGMGNNVVGSRNTRDFVETVQSNNIKEAYCVYEIDGGDRLAKRYWALSSGGTHELRQVYTAHSSLYSIKEYTKNKITFEMTNEDVFLYWYIAIAVCAVIGAIAGLVAHAMLKEAYPCHI